MLRLGAGCALAAVVPPLRAGTADGPRALPRVNGGINVQPLRKLDPTPGTAPPLIVPELVDLQMRALYELGFQWMRITISFNRFGPDFLAAIPYVRAARALGIGVLGVMSDFAGFDLVQALRQPDLRDEVLRAYVTIFGGAVAPASSVVTQPGEIALQVLNEPTHFLGIPPEAYVREFLAPVYDDLKDIDPSLTVVSAAEVGGPDGLLRLRAMIETGLEASCDRVAYHIYDRGLIPLLAGLSAKPVWVTESGAEGTQNHLGWFTDTFAEIRRTIAGVQQIFYFDLFDFEARRFRIIDIAADPELGFRGVAESQALFAHLSSRVQAATLGLPAAAYRELVPDITAYFPTPADLEVIASVPLPKP